ncbi:hypothetical protein NPIL_204931 [Nephila pilipes]|uniref:Uncharacterized protein n=1 Tax=Nephila pilipes TaxID=299642 RepID=A0A8X6R3M2_NEPPI|nr:hypothetical protein NPIL_204931 [Nephila pilipes]
MKPSLSFNTFLSSTFGCQLIRTAHQNIFLPDLKIFHYPNRAGNRATSLEFQGINIIMCSDSHRFCLEKRFEGSQYLFLSSTNPSISGNQAFALPPVRTSIRMTQLHLRTTIFAAHQIKV